VRVHVESCLKIGVPQQGLGRLERFTYFAEQRCMRVPEAVPGTSGNVFVIDRSAVGNRSPSRESVFRSGTAAAT
jgi:hypothetical protein